MICGYGIIWIKIVPPTYNHMYVHIHIHDPLQDVYQKVEKIKSGPLFLPSINDLQVVVLHPANRKSGMAEILDRKSRTSMEVSVFCPSALTQIQS